MPASHETARRRPFHDQGGCEEKSCTRSPASGVDDLIKNEKFYLARTPFLFPH